MAEAIAQITEKLKEIKIAREMTYQMNKNF